MAEQFTNVDLFQALTGRTYPSYRAFESDVITVFNEHLAAFPPHYSYRDAISWAQRRGWLDPVDHGVRVDLHTADT